MTLIIGHRGSRATHAENTFPSFEEALDCGAHWLELDVQLSYDRIPIVYHDPVITPKHCAYVDGKKVGRPALRKLTISEIKKFRCGRKKLRTFPNQIRLDVPIPTFSEFLEWFREKESNVKLLIDIKNKVGNSKKDPSLIAPEEVGEVIVKQLEEYSLIDKSVLQSFDPRIIDWIKKNHKHVFTSLLVDKDRNFHKHALEQNFKMVTVNERLVDKKKMQWCKERGIKVFVWTVNTEKRWKKLLSIDVDGIITDSPRSLKEYLRK